MGVESGITIAKHSSDYRFSFDNTTLILDYNSFRAEVPVMFSFSVPRDRWQPLFKIGGAFAYSFNDSHPVTEIKADPIDGSITRNEYTISSPNISFGVGVGGELRHKLSANLGALLGLEYFLFLENGDQRLIDASRLDINMGVTYAF